MTILITGSRSLTDQLLIDQACDTFILESGKRGLSGFSCLKHGAAGGVDTRAANWAKRHGVVPVAFPAKWDLVTGLPKDKLLLKYRRNWQPYNALAGLNRNQEMIDSGFGVLLAIRCIGKSNGTDSCIACAKKLNNPIFLYREDGTYEWLS